MLFRDSAKIDNQCIFVRLGLAPGLTSGCCTVIDLGGSRDLSVKDHQLDDNSYQATCNHVTRAAALPGVGAPPPPMLTLLYSREETKLNGF